MIQSNYLILQDYCIYYVFIWGKKNENINEIFNS